MVCHSVSPGSWGKLLNSNIWRKVSPGGLSHDRYDKTRKIKCPETAV